MQKLKIYLHYDDKYESGKERRIDMNIGRSKIRLHLVNLINPKYGKEQGAYPVHILRGYLDVKAPYAEVKVHDMQEKYSKLIDLNNGNIEKAKINAAEQASEEI